MDLKTIEDFATTPTAAEARQAITARVEGGQKLQTPAPFRRQIPSTLVSATTFS